MIILKHNNEIIETTYSDYLTLKSELNIPFNLKNIDEMLLNVENLVQQKFPEEFEMPVVHL